MTTNRKCESPACKNDVYWLFYIVSLETGHTEETFVCNQHFDAFNDALEAAAKAKIARN